MPKSGTRELKHKRGIVQDERAQDQPADKKTAQEAGLRAQREAARQAPESPGQPSKGE
jgi:hypothetical protein